MNNLANQKGQAIPLGLALIMMVTLGGLVLFNTGQMTSEKSRLTNAADAAVYSGLIWQARALNFQSYTNRAMVANQVSIAQLVSLSSWSSYQKVTSKNLDTYLGWIPFVGQVTKYYSQITNYVDQIVQPLLQAAVSVLDIVTGVLSTTLQVMYVSTFAATPSIVKEVVERNDDRYKVDSTYNIASLARNALKWGELTDRYDNSNQDEISRKGDLITASRDDFSRKRSFIEPGTKLPGIGFDNNWLWLGSHRYNIVKDGETRLIHKPGSTNSEWEWKAKDTISLHSEKWKPKWHNWLRFKKHRELLPVGWGESFVQDDIECGSGSNCPKWATDGKRQNPKAEGIADNNALDIGANYSGVRAYYDLKDLSETNQDPRLLLRVEVNAPDKKIRTSTKIPNLGSPNPPGGSNRRGVVERGMFYAGDKLSGNVASAVGSGEVYFKRPVYGPYDRPVYEKGRNQLIALYNGRKIVRKEYASLFNPYWEVRLIELPKQEQMAAWLINSPELAGAASSGVVAGVQAYISQQAGEIRLLKIKQQQLQTALSKATTQSAKNAIQQRLSSVQQRLNQLNTAVTQTNALANNLQQTGISASIRNAGGLANSLPNYGSAGAAIKVALNNGVNATQILDQAKDVIVDQAKAVLKKALTNAAKNVAKSSLQKYGGNTVKVAQGIYNTAQTANNVVNNKVLIPLQQKLASLSQQLDSTLQGIQDKFDVQNQVLQQQLLQKQSDLAAATDPLIAAQLTNNIDSLNNQISQLNLDLQTKLNNAASSIQQKIDAVQQKINSLQSSTQNGLNKVGTLLGK
jgi:predicted  nucleic acid-binding Zn-ribbon protein